MNNKRSTRRFAPLLATVALMTLGACKTDQKATDAGAKPSANIQVRFGTGGEAVDYGAFYVAKAKRVFDEALSPLNATMTSVEFPSPPVINEALASNKIDVMFVAEIPVTVGKAAGVDVKIVAISCSLTQEILVHKGAMTSISGLRGKKIAVLAGSSSHFGVVEILKTAHLTTNDVLIVNMLPPDAKNAFETGQVDAWAVWPPFVEQEELASRGVALGGGTAQINSIVAMRGRISERSPGHRSGDCQRGDED